MPDAFRAVLKFRVSVLRFRGIGKVSKTLPPAGEVALTCRARIVNE